MTTYVYDAYGNLLSKQDPGGNCAGTPPTGCTTYSYDAANQLTGISYSDGVTPNVSGITYDGDGQRLSMTDGTGTSSWGWDSLHRMVSYQNGNGAQLQWVYNLRNLATTITYPGALNATRGYDNAGRWTSVRDWNSNTTSFGYDADSNLTTETFPSASTVVDTFSFNAADQMTNVASVKGGSTTLFSAGYTRDSANQLTTDSSGASGTGYYKYTPLNQVCYAGSSNTNACSSPPSGSIDYAYDAADNLTQKGSTQQAFNNADELCWTASTSAACGSPPSGATTYQYDTRGNRTNVTPSGGQAQTLTFDQANRLTKFAAASTTSYGYNGDGLRMCKYVGSSTQPCQQGGATQYLWDVAGSLPLSLKDGTTAYVFGPGGLPIEQVNTSATYWFHHDQLGSTRLLTDSTGTSQATYTYEPYGGIASSTGSITNPLRYCGQYLDTESGFYYLRGRYYDPGTGQFGNQDAAIRTTRQPFSYSNDNPLNGSDPAGLACVGVQGGAVGFLGSIIGGPRAGGNSTSYIGVCTNGDVFYAGTVGGYAGTSPSQTSCYPYCSQPTVTQGAYGSIGLGVFASPNASCAQQLKGPFTQTVVGTGAGFGGDVATAYANGVTVATATFLGPAFGAGITNYETNTVVYSFNPVQAAQSAWHRLFG